MSLRKGETVVGIDRAARTIRTQTGAVETYDELIIAVERRISSPGIPMNTHGNWR
jgi:nitrite reductase (NADH) large subunit